MCHIATAIEGMKWRLIIGHAGAIGNVYSQHKFASSAEEASEFCLKAGCDWNCGETQKETAILSSIIS